MFNSELFITIVNKLSEIFRTLSILCKTISRFLTNGRGRAFKHIFHQIVKEQIEIDKQNVRRAGSRRQRK